MSSEAAAMSFEPVVSRAAIEAKAEQAVRDMLAKGLTEDAPNPYPPYSAAAAHWKIHVQKVFDYSGAPEGTV